MTLLIVLIALVVQRFFKFNSYSRQFEWASPYFQWMSKKVSQVTTGHGLLGLLILVLPIILITAIIVNLAYGLFGYIGVGILQLVLVWYCFDGRDIRKEPYTDATPASLLLQTYQHLFAALFWYCLFGPVGLVLYVCVNQLANVIPKTLSSTEEEMSQSNNTLHQYLTKTQGVLDWVPVRLLGLSFALVGSFAAVFKLWMKRLFDGIVNPTALVVEWGQAALSAEAGEDGQLEPVINLIDRSLLIWLIVVFLVTIGLFLG